MTTKHMLGENWSGTADEYQHYILQFVSRTFALTTPQLPMPLQRVVANAYLLCRTADTIEDEAQLTAEQKHHFLDAFTAVVAGRAPVDVFVAELHPLLSQATPLAERDLVRNLPLVLQIMAGFNGVQRVALTRCVRVMSGGMHEFQCNAGIAGLRDREELDRYCYFVAGVVGEMLTDLFCDYSPEIARNRVAMQRLDVSFGQALQMVNILKDVWDDRARGVVWYPRDVFERHGFDLSALSPSFHDEAFGAGLQELVGIAHVHLRNALSYIRLIPTHETGIRRFCAWAVGLAILTLRNVHRNPSFNSGAQVKVSRGALARVIMFTNMTVGSNNLLTALFMWMARELPIAPLTPSGGAAFGRMAGQRALTHQL
jgi:farnesyl-diphosphate farnesyltransferase